MAATLEKTKSKNQIKERFSSIIVRMYAFITNRNPLDWTTGLDYYNLNELYLANMSKPNLMCTWLMMQSKKTTLASYYEKKTR